MEEGDRDAIRLKVQGMIERRAEALAEEKIARMKEAARALEKED